MYICSTGETMNQRFSVLGLIFSVFISADNSTSFFSNALKSEPLYMNNNRSTAKMKTVFLNK